MNDMTVWDEYNYLVARGKQMERQKMAEMVLARMRSRREEEERTRPEVQVLRLEVVFAIQRGTALRGQLSDLQQKLRLSQQTLERLQAHGQQLDSTGKRPFPRIILLPEFIATERIDSKYKDFYRKAGNSFLRYEILRGKEHQRAVEWQRECVEGMGGSQDLARRVTVVDQEETKNVNKRRLAVLKQELYLRRLKREQQALRLEIASQETANSILQEEYSSKKWLVQSSSQRMQKLQEDINRYRSMIETRFNPETYRDFVGGVFTLKMKNEALRRSVSLVREEIHSIRGQQWAIQGEPGRISKSRINQSKRGSFFKQEDQRLSQIRKPEKRRLKTEQVSTKITPLHTEPSERITRIPSSPYN